MVYPERAGLRLLRLRAGEQRHLRAEAGIRCFGPGAEAARLEGSKAYAKEVMAAAEVPTALAHVCTTEEQLAEALDAFGAPFVVKDDGLAAGKGVVVTADHGMVDVPDDHMIIAEDQAARLADLEAEFG